MNAKYKSLLMFGLLFATLICITGCSKVEGMIFYLINGRTPLEEVDCETIPVKVLSEEEGGFLQDIQKNYNLYGYHVLNKPYINGSDVSRLPILDEEKFEEKSRLFVQAERTAGNASVKTYMADKMSEIYVQMNGSDVIGCAGAVFAQNIRTEYSAEFRTSGRQLFITCMKKYAIKSVEYIGREYDLYAMLSEEFLKDLSRVDKGELSAAQFFEDYGTHLILEYELGGRIRINYNHTLQKNEDKDRVKRIVEDIYKGITGDMELERIDGIAPFISSTKITFQSFGGKSIKGSNLKELEGSMKGWMESVEKNPVLCGIHDFRYSLKPVWEILLGNEYESVREKLQEEFMKQAVMKPALSGELDNLVKNKH